VETDEVSEREKEKERPGGGGGDSRYTVLFIVSSIASFTQGQLCGKGGSCVGPYTVHTTISPALPIQYSTIQTINIARGQYRAV
jgi:hypothetical protein